MSESALPLISQRLVVPQYDRSRLLPSIVHVGVGGFHRAHQAVYLDDLAHRGARDCGVVGVSLRSPVTRAAMTDQDGLFSVVQRESGHEDVRVIGVMQDCLFAGDDPAGVIARLAAPTTRIVTMTVTGDAYAVAPGGAFRADAPEVLQDLCHPHAPLTWYGYLTEALASRRRSGLGGFTVLSCDNVADSGGAARAALVGYARMRDETLARWIERHVSFPDSMVDRITPGSDAQLRRHLARSYGVSDRLAVTTERFTQWVVQDAFCQGRPPLEDVGVQVVTDVAPYKVVKTRVLNGAHTAIAYLGWLAGHRTTSDVADDPLMRAFLETMLRVEVAPALPHLTDMPADHYVTQVLDRLGNSSIADPLSRLCRRGSTKVPAYLLPSLADALACGRPAPLLTLALAGWFRYLRGTDLQGREIDVTDPRLDDLQARALRGGDDPTHLLSASCLVDVLGQDPGLVWSLRRAMRDLEHGVGPAVESRLSGARTGHAPSARPGPAVVLRWGSST